MHFPVFNHHDSLAIVPGLDKSLLLLGIHRPRILQLLAHEQLLIWMAPLLSVTAFKNDLCKKFGKNGAKVAAMSIWITFSAVFLTDLLIFVVAVCQNLSTGPSSQQSLTSVMSKGLIHSLVYLSW